MKKIVIPGAGGQVAQWVIRALAGREDIALTLLLRNPAKLPAPVPANAAVLAGDVLDQALLRQTMPGHEVDYELTTRHAPFKGTVVSRKSVADLIASIIEAPELHRHANLGVHKPNTDGDKPYFM
ncbi:MULTISPECIES: NAD(P)H-binding protein [unclassified Janthinobacterium]|uniref:NAD(P)H-binding protein n=1 Tax=unclassified Janthinobacterium TaxID=2610881 RepID=UPI001E2BF1E9|nr:MULTISPECIES: NAD(P)H-binding protein [unclassified Janthinobacterium]MCC7641967.1 NAD(P)H-binding protein [Janthinobacterium sp. EB271-G4-3-1]MCC7690093.1 NAD(P)H-binding protein [Janthinobacterium sp. EB271-G4-3-2]